MDEYSTYNELKHYKALSNVMILRVAQAVYTGDMSTQVACYILGYNTAEFNLFMYRTYGSEWEELARLNYNIDRNGD